MSPTPHLPPDRIVAFGLGRLPPAEAAEHLESCGECARLLDALPADPFVAALRDAADPGGAATTAALPAAGAPTARCHPSGEASDRSDEPAPPAVPGYEVLGVLGRGGMGVVYKARQVLADRVVALKVIRSGAHASAEEVARFRTEAAAVARLSHPHVVPVFEVGEHAGLPFFSLQFCPGGTLAERLAGNPLPPRDAVGDPLYVARLQALLGRAQRGLGHTARAEVLLTRAAQTFEALLGEGHPEALDARGGLAATVRDAGRPAEAIPILERILAEETRRLGADHPDTLTTLGNLASTYWTVGRYDRSIPLFEAALKGEQARLGPEHPQTLKTPGHLGMNYAAAGRHEAGIRLLADALRKWEEVRGPDHPDTLETMGNLAAAYWKVGRLDRSVPLFEEELRWRRLRFGPDHPQTLKTMMDLGTNYCGRGDRDAGLPLLEEAAARYGTSLGDDHPDTLFCRNNLAAAYWRAGRLDRSVPLLAETLARQRVNPGPDHPDTAGRAAQFGLNLLRQEKYADAEPPLRAALAAREKAQPAGWVTSNTRSMLGEVLLAGYQGLKARSGQIPEGVRRERLEEAVDRLVALAEASGAAVETPSPGGRDRPGVRRTCRPPVLTGSDISPAKPPARCN